MILRYYEQIGWMCQGWCMLKTPYTLLRCAKIDIVLE